MSIRYQCVRNRLLLTIAATHKLTIPLRDVASQTHIYMKHSLYEQTTHSRSTHIYLLYVCRYMISLQLHVLEAPFMLSFIRGSLFIFFTLSLFV